ncbi:hypothetical protein QTI24_07100 [Variovorax sp. J22P240]|uniref:hypothetical protein n=1 Tax=Variovorax sp. J22P240 TaxID=3053514 RepID=UPI002575354F|nr:hypothetical protein [Variovorax sp. J22P240]MDL9998358.1 hypothetical protein [Variovorax sp. J22P240]
MNTDNIESVQQLLVKLAHIASQIEARSADAMRRIEATTGAMHQGVERLDGGVERFTQQATQAISHGSQAAVAQGAHQALERFNQELEQSTGRAKWAADALGEQRRSLALAQRGLIWKGLIALTIGSLLAASGSAFVAWQSMREIRKAEFGTSILRATRSGALSVCGEERALCVKVGPRPRRAAGRGEYLLVEE